MAIELSPESLDQVHNLSTNPALAQALGGKVLVNIVGPTATGKSTLMDQACRMDPDFGRVVSFTTRPPRPQEDAGTYRFLPHTEGTIADIEAKIASGTIVQLAVHPTTHYLYGSEVADYPAKYNVIDMLFSEVEQMRRLPFGYMVTIGLAVEPNDWKTWFMQRHELQDDKVDALKRLDEAEQSLAWALADIDTMWALNRAGYPKKAARDIISMARGDSDSDNRARVQAIRMHTDAIPQLRDLVTESAA